MQSDERKLSAAVVRLMNSKEFADMAGILMLGSRTVSDDVPTACTNGRDEVYGRAFVKSLKPKELAFVIAHESMHKLYRQLVTWKKLFAENPRLANMAADYVVNLAIVNRDPHGNVVSMPMRDGKPIGLLDTRFEGMNTKEVFNLLKQEQEQEQGQGQPLDDHDWESANSLSRAEQEQLAKDIDQAIRQGRVAAQRLHGTGAGGRDRELDALLYPKVDWREALREFITSTCSGRDFSSWRRINRRYLSQDLALPITVSERLERIAIAVDTSGSIQKELQRFLTEVKDIMEGLRPEYVDLIYWDTQVAAHEVYTEATLDTLLQSTKPRGGGGTAPRCVSDYLFRQGIKPQCVVMFTDGYVGSDWGQWDVPVLWCITTETIMAPSGRTVHVVD
ncbi:MAG: DUF2201 family putative metallopeptidase [Thermoflexales bacterium]